MSEQEDGSMYVLPPIIRCGKDRAFLKSVYTDIHSDLENIQSNKPEQSYLIYKEAFDKVIGYVTSYKPILTAIKAEYEEVIETVQRGHRDAFFLQSQIQALATQPSTLENYRKRYSELEMRLQELSNSNTQLRDRITNVREERLARERAASEENNETEKKPVERQVRRDPRPIPGLSVDEMINREALKRELERVDQILREVTNSEKTKFVPREKKERLNRSLVDKLERREAVIEQIGIVSARESLLMAAVKAAQSFHKSPPMHQSIGEVVLRALKGQQAAQSATPTAYGLMTEASTLTSTTEAQEEGKEEEDGKDEETDSIVGHLDRFTDLMEKHDWTGAIWAAVNSPRGLLRTMDVLLRFKEVDSVDPSQMILLTFCEALLATVPAFRKKPSADLSIECVSTALDHGRIDLIAHWLTNDRLTLSELMGDLMVSDSVSHDHHASLSLDLASFIFDGCEPASRLDKAVECLLKAGRVGAALARASQGADREHRFSAEDYRALLRCYPKREVVIELLETGLMEWKDVVGVLAEEGQHTVLAATLEAWVERQREAIGAPPTAEIIQSLLEETPDLDAEFWQTVVTAGPQDMTCSHELLAAAVVMDSMRSSLARIRGLIEGGRFPIFDQDDMEVHDIESEQSSDDMDNEEEDGDETQDSECGDP